MSDDKGWTMLAGDDADASEVDRLRLALLTMGARERETAAERDALRTMLAEARERSGPSDDRLSRLTALMLRVAARRDQLTSELSVVTGECGRLRAEVTDLTDRLEEAHDGGEVVAHQLMEMRARLEGSTVPPTIEDLIAHDGAWMVLLPDAEHPDVAMIRVSPEGVVTARFSDGDAMELRRWKEGMAEADGTRWWPIGRDGLIAERATEGNR